MRQTIRLALLCSLVFASGSARADNLDDKIAKAHFGTGQDYFNAGRFEPAVKEFLEAYRLSRKVDLLWNIARCYSRLDDPGRMTQFFKRYLASRPDASDRANIEAEMEKVAPRVATLALHSAVPGSELRIDGEVVGLAPIEPVLLTEGKHHLEASHADYTPAAADVELLGGRSTDVSVDPLDPTTQAMARNVAPAATAASTALMLQASPPPPHRRWLWPVVGGAALVVAAAVVLVAILVSGSGTDFAARARMTCTDPMSCTLVDGAK